MSSVEQGECRKSVQKGCREVEEMVNSAGWWFSGMVVLQWQYGVGYWWTGGCKFWFGLMGWGVTGQSLSIMPESLGNRAAHKCLKRASVNKAVRTLI